MTDINSPPVNWDLVSSLDQNYQTTIKKRMPALFQSGSGDNVVSTHLRITGPSSPGGGRRGKGTAGRVYM